MSVHLPERLQALHPPRQAVSQHTASTQLTLTHSLDAPQPSPSAFFGTHEAPSQYRPATHWVSRVQLDGQAAALPEQKYGAHDGLPAEPAGLVVQVPSEPVKLQESHPAPQAVLQQTWSAQNPVVQSPANTQVSPRVWIG